MGKKISTQVRSYVRSGYRHTCLFWFCVTHSESSTSTIPVPVPVPAVRDRNPMMSDVILGKAGHRLQQGRATSLSLYVAHHHQHQHQHQHHLFTTTLWLAAVVMTMTAGQTPSPTQPVLRSKLPRHSPDASPITSASGVYCLSSRCRVRSSHGKFP